jgi:hypothetical protein
MSFSRTQSGREIARQSVRRLGSSFRAAVTVMLKVLRNVTAGVTLSSLFAVLFSRGNVFVPMHEQSICGFSTANGVSYIGFQALLTMVYLSSTLMDTPFTSSPATSRPRTFLKWLWKLSWCLSGHLIAVCVVTALVVRFATCKVRECRLDIYFAAICSQYLVICMDIYARQLFRTGTPRGLMLTRQRTQLAARGQDDDGSRHCREQQRHISRRVVLSVAKMNAPLFFSSVLAIVYVHTITLVLDTSQQWQIVALLVGSMLLKVIIHTSIRAAFLRWRSIPRSNVMMSLIATPTILIETQVRVYQLRLGSNTSKVVSIVALALFEIAIRAGKLEVTKRKLARREKSFVARAAATLPPSQLSSPCQPSEAEADTDKNMLRALHTTESFAEMYAEYIAMGCAHAIFVCFSEHPFFAFAPGSASTRYVDRAYWLILLLQIAVELVVDTAACTVEMLMGSKLERLDQDDWSVMLYLVLLAFVNIGMCAGLYLRTDEV